MESYIYSPYALTVCTEKTLLQPTPLLTPGRIFTDLLQNNPEYMDTPATNYRMTNGVLFEIQHHLRRRLTHSSPAEHCKLTSHSNYCTDKKRGRVNHPAGDLPQGWTRQQQNTSQYQKSNRNHPEHTQSIYGLNYLKRIRYSNDATGWTLGSSNAGRGTFFFSAIRTRPL